MATMQYKGYMAQIDVDEEADLFHGQVVNLRDVITFQGRSVEELRQAFADSVEDYLEFCAERGEAPEEPPSGRFVRRMPPEVDRSTSSDIPEANSAPPLLVVLSGPSGVGKDAALTGLKKLERLWHFVVTATTRPRRPEERDGVDYIFLDTDTFLRMKERDEFIECAQVYGRWYGVPRSQVRAALRAGRDVVVKVDVQGAATLRRLAPEALLIFMLPASFDELRRRLAQRMTETSREMELRLDVGREEIAQIKNFDYRVINRDNGLDQTIAEIDAIITAEKCRVVPRLVQIL